MASVGSICPICTQIKENNSAICLQNERHGPRPFEARAMMPAGPGAQGLVSASGDPEDQNKVHSASESPQMPIARSKAALAESLSPKGPQGPAANGPATPARGIAHARGRPPAYGVFSDWTIGLSHFSAAGDTKPTKHFHFKKAKNSRNLTRASRPSMDSASASCPPAASLQFCAGRRLRP